ncbi:Gfo/Idh/MocA family protein [Luteolibacter sp. Populi]|uniref:Gfo/Idh/MocA family protein n=1 Tax=Luteolibacter sp. Populi TaxID=3230487 RepID=UPI003466EB76
MKLPLGYGLIGCGGFGRFCLQAYRQIDGLACLAVADSDPELARTTAAEFGLDFASSPAALLARPDIGIVHLATPPFTHASLALQALEAGKHVLCEKPLALRMEDAEVMVALARQKGLLLAVNLIMRYNPLCRAVKHLVESRLLGEPIFASFINAAQDEALGPAHWFWDPAKSGGIFIEHGVHFFDLFEWWFGPGEVLSAHQIARPDSGIIDQVQCCVRYGAMTLASFYHGFHQMRRRDQQGWEIIFETGTLRMSEWVPTRLQLDLHGTGATISDLAALFPGAEIEVVERYPESAQPVVSRHQPREVTVHARLAAGAGLPKMELYGEILRALMKDQLQAIADPGHLRTISESNGLSSLAYAVAAQAIAERGT